MAARHVAVRNAALGAQRRERVLCRQAGTQVGWELVGAGFVTGREMGSCTPAARNLPVGRQEALQSSVCQQPSGARSATAEPKRCASRAH